MNVTISQIMGYLKIKDFAPRYKGEENAHINGFCSLSNLKSKSLIWVKDLDKFDIISIDDELNLIIITNKMYTGSKKLNIIAVASPKAAYFSLLAEFFAEKPKPFIAPNSIILSNRVAGDVSIGYSCFIDKDVTIGARTVIRNNVSIQNRVGIGEDCIIESGTTIGVAGYGYYEDACGQMNKVPDFGGVQIGDRVELGANSCIARGTLGDTIVGNDVKIDNLVHIAHNVVIEDECMIVAQSMLGGSVRLGKHAYVAPCAAIINQAEIGENALVGMGAVVIKNIDYNKVVAGVPARVVRVNIQDKKGE